MPPNSPPNSPHHTSTRHLTSTPTSTSTSSTIVDCPIPPTPQQQQPQTTTHSPHNNNTTTTTNNNNNNGGDESSDDTNVLLGPPHHHHDAVADDDDDADDDGGDDVDADYGMMAAFPALPSKEEVLLAINATDQDIKESGSRGESLRNHISHVTTALNDHIANPSLSCVGAQWIIDCLPLIKHLLRANQAKQAESVETLSRLTISSPPHPAQTAKTEKTEKIEKTATTATVTATMPSELAKNDLFPDTSRFDPAQKRDLVRYVIANRKNYQREHMHNLRNTYEHYRQHWVRRLEKRLMRSRGKSFEITPEFWEADGSTDHDRWIGASAELPPMQLSLVQEDVAFINSNGLVEDPLLADKTAANINPWTATEVSTFIQKFLIYPKNFGKIASYLPNKSFGDVVEYYYRKKHSLKLRDLLKKHQLKKRGGNLGRGAVAATQPQNAANSAIAATSSRTKKGGVSIMAGAGGQRRPPQPPQPQAQQLSQNQQHQAVHLQHQQQFQQQQQQQQPQQQQQQQHHGVELAQQHQQQQQQQQHQQQHVPTTSPAFGAARHVEGIAEESSRWTDSERDLLIDAMRRVGRDWRECSALVRTKSAAQCKNFYHNLKRRTSVFDDALNEFAQSQLKSDPTAIPRITRSTVNHDDPEPGTTPDGQMFMSLPSEPPRPRVAVWTEEEKEMAIGLYSEMGRDWKRMSATIGTKTPGQVRNFFQSSKTRQLLEASPAPQRRKRADSDGGSEFPDVKRQRKHSDSLLKDEQSGDNQFNALLVAAMKSETGELLGIGALMGTDPPISPPHTDSHFQVKSDPDASEVHVPASQALPPIENIFTSHTTTTTTTPTAHSLVTSQTSAQTPRPTQALAQISQISQITQTTHTKTN